MAENLTPQELYELRRQEKRGQRENATSTGPTPRSRLSGWWLVLVIAMIIIIGIVWLIKNSQPLSPDQSQAVAIQNRDHITVGQAHDPYNSNPPTSGWHYVDTAPTGFHQTAIADEYIIHNLEHGDIWLSYQPSVSEATKTLLKKFAGPYVIVTPREANPKAIALAAWGRLDTFSEAELTVERVADFIKRYDNEGPEKVRMASSQ